ncbi:MAG: uroporphyrinogen decarboxylase [Anaerolineae bacterium]|nr:uroporphyrinogen decarboxylase [Anaerolineae bacterium]
MDKRERLERAINGETLDRVPVALWRHFPGDDQRAADFAAAVIAWQKTYDWDFVKITPASSFCITDYGVQDRWVGALEGTREYIRRAVERSIDWTTLKALEPARGALARQIQTLDILKSEFGEAVPYIQTIFSPLAQAKNIAGEDRLIRHLRTDPERVHTGLRTITESTLRFMDAIRKIGISGIFYAIQHATYSKLSEDEYRAFGVPYDKQILGAAQAHGWWFNMLHLHGDVPMFDLIADYPVQAVNWHDQETPPDLAVGKSKISGAVCGGLGRWDVHNGTPLEIREQARNAISLTNGRRFILSTGCVAMVTTPTSNLRAVREVVDTTRI